MERSNFRRRIGAVVAGGTLALLGAAGQAAADESTTTTINDLCGDTGTYLYVNQIGFELTQSEQTKRFDLQQVALGAVPGGTSVRLQACGPIGTPDPYGGSRSVTATLPDGCTLSLTVNEPVLPLLPRDGQITKTCWRTPSRPVNVSSTRDTRFSIALPPEAIAVDNGALVVTVLRAGLTGEAADAFAPGTVWQHTVAEAREGESLSPDSPVPGLPVRPSGSLPFGADVAGLAEAVRFTVS